jgi:hypothetical protein
LSRVPHSERSLPNRRIGATLLLVLTCLVATWHVGTSASADGNTSNGNVSDNSIGIRLLDAPVSRRDDPRAQVYIVDFVAPGTTVKRRVLITNNSATPRRVDVFAGAASIDNNEFDALSGRATNELTSWISTGRNTIDMPARGTATVLVTIAVPRTAASGERYGVIWAETSAPMADASTVTMVSRVGVRLYLDVGTGGEPASSFVISDLTPARAPDGQPEVRATVRNNGGRALDMAGDLSLSNGPGSLNAGPFPATLGLTLLPGHTGTVQVLLDKRLPDGPWQVRLTLRSGAIEQTVTATMTFPTTANTIGQAVVLDGSVGSHLFVIVSLAVLLGAMAVLLILAARRWLVVRRG